MDKKKYQSFLATLPKPSKPMHYGTAGYRSKYGNDIELAVQRTALFGVVRSAILANKYVGLMVTASHNHHEDNGVKAIDHNGDALDEECEKLMDEVVNGEDLYRTLNKFHRKYGKMRDLGDGLTGRIILGRDTRDSGEKLVKAIVQILKAVNAEFVDYGVVSTPQLTFLVRQSNSEGLKKKEDYFEHLNFYYNKLEKIRKDVFDDGRESGFDVDTANGTAGVLIDEFRKINSAVKFNVLNKKGKVNENCGAEFVKQKKKSIPGDFKFKLKASFDGDSDRLILYTVPFEMMDGDAQCVFLVDTILKCKEVADLGLSVGAVLSHYSNSAALKYLEKKCKVLIAKTGVKNSVDKARQFDVGVYYEPNGHGSIHFSQNALKSSLFSILAAIFDPCVGDAFANLLFFNVFPPKLLYRPYPTRDIAVQCGNLLTDENNVVLEPLELKNRIEMVLSEGDGKGFVRKSGTEEVVRVHVEGKTQELADKMCVDIAQAVFDLCGGKGKFPDISYV